MSSSSEVESNSQTLKELKTNLKNALRKSGVLDTVKAQIRKEFIVGLTEKLPVKGIQPSKISGQVLNLRERLSLSVIYHFLKQRNFNNSLSVYAAECGLDSKAAWLSEMDIVKSMQFGTQTDVYRSVAEKENQEENSIIVSSSSTSNGRKSLFDILLDHLHVDPNKASLDTCVQTESATGSNLRGPRESLDYQMQNLRTSFLSQRDAERSSPVKSVEERMISFQKECEERYRREADSYVAYIRETEISKVRLDEAQKARNEMDALRKQLEMDYQRRLQEHAEREDASVRAMTDRERQLQQMQYESRQQMQREIDELRSREQGGQRKLALETQGLEALELRLKEVKAVIESREREVSRREQLTEEKYNECLERAKAEARASLRIDLEAVQQERNALKMDRQHLQDEMSTQAALLDSAKSVRRMLKEAQAELILRDDEVEALKRRLETANEKLSHFPDDWEEEIQDDGTLRPRTLVSVLKQRNAALEAGLAAQIHNTKEAEIEKRVALVVDALNARADQLKEQIAKLEVELASAIKDKDALRRAAHAERVNGESARMKNEELVKVVREQKATIDGLIKQHESMSRSQQSHKAIDEITSLLASRKKRDQQYNEGSGSGSGYSSNTAPSSAPQYIFAPPYPFAGPPNYPPSSSSPWTNMPPPPGGAYNYPAHYPSTTAGGSGLGFGSFELSLPSYQPVLSVPPPPQQPQPSQQYAQPSHQTMPGTYANTPYPSATSSSSSSSTIDNHRTTLAATTIPSSSSQYGQGLGSVPPSNTSSEAFSQQESFRPTRVGETVSTTTPVTTSVQGIPPLSDSVGGAASVAAARELELAEQARIAAAQAAAAAAEEMHKMKLDLERQRLEMSRKEQAWEQEQLLQREKAIAEQRAALEERLAREREAALEREEEEHKKAEEERRRREAEETDRRERERIENERKKRLLEEDKRKAEEAARIEQLEREKADRDAALVDMEKKSAARFIEELQQKSLVQSSPSPSTIPTQRASITSGGGGGLTTIERRSSLSPSNHIMEVSNVERGYDHSNNSISHHQNVNPLDDDDVLSAASESPRSGSPRTLSGFPSVTAQALTPGNFPRGSAVMAKSTFDKILEESMGVIDVDDGIEGGDVHYGYTIGGGERNRFIGGIGMGGAVGAAGAEGSESPYYPRQDDTSNRDTSRRVVNEEETSSSSAAAGSSTESAVVEEVVVPPETDEERAIREAQERKRSDDEEIEERKRKVAERRKREAEQREKDAELLRASQESARTLLKTSTAQMTPSSSSESHRLDGPGSGSGDRDSPTSSGEKGAPGKLFADATEIEIESQDEIEDQEGSAEQSSEGW